MTLYEIFAAECATPSRIEPCPERCGHPVGCADCLAALHVPVAVAVGDTFELTSYTGEVSVCTVEDMSGTMQISGDPAVRGRRKFKSGDSLPWHTSAWALGLPFYRKRGA